MRIGIYFASTSGNTDIVADYIVDFLGADIVKKHDIAEVGFADIESFDLILFGIPTWDYGQLQSDWEDCWDELKALDLSKAQVAIFGLGDQFGYPEWYLDAMGKLHDVLMAKNVARLGYWPNEGYEFEASKALTEDGKSFVGLALDEESQSALTESRVEAWCCSILEDYATQVA